ncbi:integrase core domain protein [Necator americanus]|uniref:RNA-directed DNA polymerase n=1 Tax=Necator americanus TaxID=51031 RepID=W2TRS8_NECAM|nr:integrase core domain protein [Necator americanus]ETN83732.1 integrase core domain protein [Necator americanus]
MLETQVAFLGHVVDKEGVRMDPDKVNNIHQYPRPNNLPELRTFLGMTGYYRKFILRYAQTAKPLYELTSTKVKFEWNSQHERAFITLKELLTHAPVLAQPNIEKARNGSRPFIIYTDASKVGIGAVLAQEQDDGFLHPLYFASKPLSRAEQNYHVTDQEGLAVVYALKKFHYFIYGIPTILRTDHATLTSLFKRTNVSSRVLRWALEVQRYDLTIQHVKGSANSVADALSRGIASADQDSSTPTLEENEKVVCLITETWMDELREDDDFTSVIEAVESGKETEVRLPRHERKLNTKDFVIHNNQLKLIAEDGSLLLVVPRSKRREIFDEGHHVDLLEMGLTSRGTKYIVTVIDHFSKYLGAYPVPDKQADTIAEAIFSHWICDGGRWPECILSDRGGEFENAVVAALCEILQIKQEFTKGYCPRENGLTERVNGTIVRMLKKKTLIPTDWDRMLPAVVYAYNASPHSATSESPHFLVYGHDPKYPPTVIPREYLSPYMIDYDEYKTQFFNSLKLARDCITEHAEKYRNTMKHQYDKRWRTKKSQVFSPGDRVYMKVPAEKGKSHHPKLTVDWRGPYRVLEASSNSALITLIGANEEPVRIQFDHLVKVPPDIDDTPIKGRTLRGRRGRPKKLEKGRTASQVSSIRISRPALKLACNMIIFRGRRSSRTDPATVDFRCPGTYEHVGQKLICKQPGPLRDVVPNAPLPYLVLRSPFELGRAVTILQQTHLPETAVRDLLLDTTYITLSPTALSVAYSYLRKGCMHIGTYLRHVHQIGSIKHSPRHRDDPFDIDNIVRRATTSMPILTAWTAEAWGTLTEKKVIVLLPHGFSDYTRGFSFKTQRAYSYLTPRDIQEDWLEGELSAIVLFSSMTNDTVDDWIEPWCHIVTAIANGADLFCVPGPRDDGNWGFGVDLLRDLCEETVSQRPSLKTRIHILLPLSSEEGDSTPFNILGVRRTNVPRFYTPSCAKRFLNATVRYYALRIKLYPFIRTDRDQHPPGNCRNDTSGNSPSTSTDGPHGHYRERTPFNSRGTWYRSRGGFAYREERDRSRYIERREERVRARNDDIERRRSSYREVGEDGTWVPRKHHAGVSHPF